MPYIRPIVRKALDEPLAPLLHELEERVWSPGELTYVLYRICIEAVGRTPRFEDIAEVLGSLEATKLELYRRHAVPYEDQKVHDNGDVIPTA